MANEVIHDIATVPNAISGIRLAAAPIIANRLEQNPENWLPAAALLATDMLDGAAARAGNSSPRLQKLGFRTSNAGKLLDHGTDAIAPLLCARAGMQSGVIPKSIGRAVIHQKTATAGYSTYRAIIGKPVEVTTLGKRAEFMKLAGLGSLFIANTIEDPVKKRWARRACLGLAAVGLASAYSATGQYVRQ